MIRVDDLSKVFVDRDRNVRAVEGVTFEVAEGKFYTLLGPSGCGKTTTLRCLAGLERPDSGNIEVAGQMVFSAKRRQFVPPNHRPIGMVFQSYAIWPHMTVFDNVAFPLRVGKQHVSRSDVRRKVEAALEMVQLEGLEGRQAPQLSGGQQQRLALARALVREPKVLLLDEPLSNLDAKLRERMRLELRDLQRRLQITTVYVTHDQSEALSMSDVIAVMQDGRIVQEGLPREIYEEPRTQFVAQFVGSSNILTGQVAALSESDGLMRISSEIGELQCPICEGAEAGASAFVVVRPENIVLHREAVEAPNVWRAIVRNVVFLGEYLDCQIDVNGRAFQTRQHPSLALELGARIWAEFPPVACSVLKEQDRTVSADGVGRPEAERTERPLSATEAHA